MREKKTHLYVDSQERTLLLHSLVELNNQIYPYNEACTRNFTDG